MGETRVNDQIVLLELFEGIDEKVFSRIRGEINDLVFDGSVDLEKLIPILLMSSRGGSMEVALTMYSFLKQLPCGLTTLALGPVDSAAVIVYLAGTTRLTSPAATFRLHYGTVSISNCPFTEIDAVVQDFRNRMMFFAEQVASLCKVSTKTADRWLKKGISFSADEAFKHGLASEVVTGSFFAK